MELWHAWTCPYCMRVRVALAEKGVPYAEREIDLGSKPPELLALNPAGGVPVLVADGVAIPESIVILQYLEDRYPDRPLLPRDPLGRARARMLYDRVTALLGPQLLRLARGTPDEKAQATEAVRAALATLERGAPERGFLLGDYSIADIALASLVLKLPPALRPSGLGLPRLAAWEAAVASRPAVAANTTVPRPARA